LGRAEFSFIWKQLPEDGIVAESWEIASHEDGMTVVQNGIFAGKTLQEVFEVLGEGLVGSKNRWAIKRGIFPLLVKLLDAKQRLSVQVHPNDDFAQNNEGK
jgi:mannose-6-phosphate isomerase